MAEDLSAVPTRGWFTAAVAGESMRPALRPGDVLLVRACRDASSYAAGSLALVHFDARPGRVMVKRVIERRGGGLWVLGDNAASSDASESFGVADPLGRVVARLWPRPGRLRRKT